MGIFPFNLQFGYFGPEFTCKYAPKILKNVYILNI